ncbi:hypothetical protein [Solimonas marina]|uniref:DUF2523 domain-containing protein n=1 Tax=Solimonas marina TaxID=2714601 RepID=A0A969WEK5_9GAMM|nr:hypothetical protein [Solimonas marina]NKF24814.1 hypothetical protein [Solimonas marina]
MLDWLYIWLQSFLSWLNDTLLYVPKWVLEKLLAGLSALLSAIPVPDWMSAASGYLSGIPSGVVWFLDIMHFGFGVTVVLSALTLRFLIHRIPFIG